LSKTKHKYGSDKEIRKKLGEHNSHRVTFQGCVRVFDGGWVTIQQIELFFSSGTKVQNGFFQTWQKRLNSIYILPRGASTALNRV
jgi:hypothetical protein